MPRLLGEPLALEEEAPLPWLRRCVTLFNAAVRDDFIHKRPCSASVRPG
jgi:hypothetical protein